MFRYYFIAGLAAALLVSCTEKAGVTGRTAAGYETFTGKIENYNSKKGQLMLTSNRGASCGGEFTRKSDNVAVGVLNCNDGRSGSFNLGSDSNGGSGSGSLGTEAFNFAFSD